MLQSSDGFPYAFLLERINVFLKVLGAIGPDERIDRWLVGVLFVGGPGQSAFVRPLKNAAIRNAAPIIINARGSCSIPAVLEVEGALLSAVPRGPRCDPGLRKIPAARWTCRSRSRIWLTSGCVPFLEAWERDRDRCPHL